MRDRRFVAMHRGGPLDRLSHAMLARWAADCAEEVLHLYTRHRADQRPAEAVAMARAWANGNVKTGAAMKAAVACHAAARERRIRLPSQQHVPQATPWQPHMQQIIAWELCCMH